MADQILNGKYIIELDELTSIALTGWLAFQPNTVSDQAFRISLTNFIKALPIIPAVAGEYADIAEMIAAQAGQTVDVFYQVLDPSDDPDYNDLKDSEIKAVYYHLPGAKTASLSDYNSIAIPKLESSKFPKLGNSLEALTFDVKFRSAEWSSNKATLQAIANALKLSSPQDLLLDALSLKLNVDNNPTDISRVLFGLDGQFIFEPINSSKIQSDSDAGDVTLDDDYALLLTITGDQNVANGIANIGLTAKSFSTGAITAFAASGNNRVRATSAAHGFSEGDYVEIVNTSNYNDIVEIKAVPNINDFDFTATFVATETGDWEKSENREIAVDLRVDSISVKEFTRQIEGEGRLNFSEQLAGLVNGEDITVYVKSNTLGEAIEILGTSQSSELKVINSSADAVNFGEEEIRTLVSGVASIGSFRNYLIAAETGTEDDMIELTGLTVGDKVQLRADTGDTITVKHNDAGATVKILLQDNEDFVLDEDHPLEFVLTTATTLVQTFEKALILTEPNTWYLNTNGNDDNVGSDKFPFKNIQAAVDVAVDNDVIIFQNAFYSSSEDVNITKTLIFRGIAYSSDVVAAAFISGTWSTNNEDLTFENVFIRAEFTHTGSSFGLSLKNCFFDCIGLPARKTDIFLYDSIWELNTGNEVRKAILRNSSVIAPGKTLTAGEEIELYATDIIGSASSGLDLSSTSKMKNSSVSTDFTAIGNLEKINAVVVGTETVSGTPTSRQAKVFDDNVLFKNQVTVEGSETTSSATIAINFTTGTNTQEVDITGNISSFTTSNEKVAGNYDVWLVNDGSIRTMVVPADWDLIPGGDTHDTAANAINLYQFTVSPSGLKRYIIKNM